MTRTLTFASLLVLAFTDVASAQTAKLNPCSLATQAEVKAAIGMDISKPAIDATMNPSGGALCAFEVGELGAGGIAMRTMPAGETPQKAAADLQKVKVKTTDAPGFGPGAFWAVSAEGVVQLNAFKGATQVTVQLMLFGPPEDKVKAALVKLMTVVLPRVK